MAETKTPNYQWTKPDIGGDSSTWGNVLNQTFDAIDSVVWNNQQGTVPIGSITMYVGVTLPPNWLWCNGAVYLNTDIPALAPILGGRYAGSDSSHNAVPNLMGRFPIGYDGGQWSMGVQGGEYNHLTLWSEMPVHSHSAWQDPHIHAAWQNGHQHYAWQDQHAHAVGQGTHWHNIVTGNHSHGISTGSHSHGYVGPGSGSWGYTFGSFISQQVSGNAQTGSAGNLGGNTDTAGNLGGYTDAQYPNVGNTDTRQPAVYTDTQTPAVAVDSRQPAVWTGNSGNGVAHNNMPPYLVVGFIIRYK